MRCPTCRKAAVARTKFFPFCSERCQMADLGKWLDEEYRASEPAGTEDAAAAVVADADAG